MDGSVTSALFLNESFKIVQTNLNEVLSLIYRKVKKLKEISDNELRSLINKELVINAKELKTNINDIIIADEVRTRFSIADPKIKIKIHRTNMQRVWYETCDDSYLIAISKYIFQDDNLRKALNLHQHKVKSLYIGQGTRTDIVSGNPDIITIDSKKKVIDVVQVKQIAITKPGDPVDLFRDLTKT